MSFSSLLFKLGPEKGVVHMGTAAITNALWDLRAKLEQKVRGSSNYLLSHGVSVASL